MVGWPPIEQCSRNRCLRSVINKKNCFGHWIGLVAAGMPTTLFQKKGVIVRVTMCLFVNHNGEQDVWIALFPSGSSLPCYIRCNTHAQKTSQKHTKQTVGNVMSTQLSEPTSHVRNWIAWMVWRIVPIAWSPGPTQRSTMVMERLCQWMDGSTSLFIITPTTNKALNRYQ